MKDVEIIKLPTIGSPYSFKTRKQGRRDSIDSIIDDSNKDFIFNKRKEIVEKLRTDIYKEDLQKMLNEYKGSCNFIKSIKEQVKRKGINCLTMKQRKVTLRILGSKVD
jgi:hypothetical protein